MDYIPLCLECDNFKKDDCCPYYQPIPFDIKNRETRCPYFMGGEYDLLGENAYAEDKAK